MMNLYQLTDAYLSVLDNLPEDVDQQAVNDTLEAIQDAIEVKARNIAAFCRSMETSAEAIDAEIKRLQSRKKALENRVKSLEQYLQGRMEAIGVDKIKSDLFTIALQNNPPALQITDQTAIPAKYLTIIPEQHVPNNEAIKAALKAGEDVPGCALVQGRHLRIR
jgi:FtsZ-binding cell division protein ZapB